MSNIQTLNESYREIWNVWLIFRKSEITTDAIQLKKQLGLLNESQDFTLRPSLLHPPSLQELFEAILNGIIRRNELGLYQTLYIFYNELQKTLQEFLKIYSHRKDIIIELFQNATKQSLTKEQAPKLVVPCNNCKSFVYHLNFCKECKNAFYCDEACMRANKVLHSKNNITCFEELQKIPQIFTPLQVELHSGSDMGDNVVIYYEHEMKMSLQMRGVKLFGYLFKFFIKHRWLKGNKYSVEEGANFLKFIKHAEEKEQAVQIGTLLPQELKHIETPPSTSRTTTNDVESQIRNERYAKMPVIQELKMIFLNFGSIIGDVLQEEHSSYTRFIHIFMFPF